MDSKAKIVGLASMIIRDSTGDIHAFSYCNLKIGYQPVIAEAMALKIIMTIFNDLGLAQVLFERDCKRVVNVVKLPLKNGLKYVSPLMYDIPRCK